LATNSQLGKSAAAGFPWGRLWFLLGALVVYRIGAHIPVPGIDPVALASLFKQNEGGILGMFNMFSGGALSRFTVFALGIMPYISASIIMQLGSIVSPQLEALKKEGEAGRRKITQYTRYFTVALALFQAFGIAVALEAQQGLVLDPGMGFRFVTVVTLLTGTMFLMWLGEQITERGLGNGISIIIFAGIAAGLPSALGSLFTLVSNGSISSIAAIFIVVLVAGGYVCSRVCGARTAQDPRELRQAPGRQQGVRWPNQPPAPEAEHGRRDPADLRVLDHPVPGDDR
jgi:preprotein translocase subunit SecY